MQTVGITTTAPYATLITTRKVSTATTIMITLTATTRTIPPPPPSPQTINTASIRTTSFFHYNKYYSFSIYF